MPQQIQSKEYTWDLEELKRLAREALRQSRLEENLEIKRSQKWKNENQNHNCHG